MNIEKAKSIPLTTLLESLGHAPDRQSKDLDEVWYRSPFRTERTPSFKVKSDRVWYDHGIGTGGTIIDFGMKYRRTDSVKEVLEWLSQYAYLANQKTQTQQRVRKSQTRKIRIKEVRPISSRILLHYLREDRKIDLLIARHHLKEIDFTVNEKDYFALAFPNRTGGWELRNAFYQGSISPKDVSVIRSPYNPENRIAVFEGFMDYLSILTQLRQEQLSSDVMVLNSVALKERSIELITQHDYSEIDTFFDNDRAGIETTKRFQELPATVNPQNHRYSEFKDVNEHHIHMHQIGCVR